MSFKANGKGIKKLIKIGIPVVALLFGGPIICIIACAVVSCIDVEEGE
ncbi:MAG: hypothetical protein J6U54_07730 [Clostridiales bacterium]|nr:hypothetical protein [Clostridiales bacterium]